MGLPLHETPVGRLGNGFRLQSELFALLICSSDSTGRSRVQTALPVREALSHSNACPMLGPSDESPCTAVSLPPSLPFGDVIHDVDTDVQSLSSTPDVSCSTTLTETKVVRSNYGLAIARLIPSSNFQCEPAHWKAPTVAGSLTSCTSSNPLGKVAESPDQVRDEERI
jgi:hypothetical protein